MLNQIKEINKISYEIISTISIFDTAIPIYVINKFFNDSEISLEGHINELCSKGILIKKIEDMGFVFDFYNNVLKNLIYNRLSDEERKAKHELAASVLEQLFKKNGRENKEELIYQLEKAKDKYRIVKYCIELAEKIKSFRIMDEAIVKYKKAFFMLSDEEDQNKKVELLLEIGDVYLSIGNLQGALESYEKTKIYSASVVEIDGELSIVASSDGNFDITDLKEILLRTKESKNSVLVSKPFDSSNNVDFKYMPKNMKSIMCIPIIRKKHIHIEKKQGEGRRVNEQLNLDNIKGYVYMESKRVLNNFNEDSLAECLGLTLFISFVMENYLLKISSSVDKLTGTFTRLFLEDELSQNIEKANASSGVFSIIMFDLDDFKGVNDKFGHITGDKVLREVSKIVMHSIRKIDVCGRFGGEEFIVILPGTDTRVASDIAERIRKNIDNKRILRSKRELTVSMGIATYPKHVKWRQELVESVDKALYVAKANGKNRCQIFENKFSDKLQGTNKLSGIVSGNVVQDSRNVLAMVELIETVKSDCDLETKIYNALGRIIETTEAKNGMLFIINENKITQRFERRNLKEDWAEVVGFSEGIIENVIIDKQGICTIDWNCIIDYDLVTEMPNWNSALVVPIIKSGVVKGILYLTVPIKVKEFKFEDLNFVNTLGQLLVGMI